jgi:hypothetical protein
MDLVPQENNFELSEKDKLKKEYEETSILIFQDRNEHGLTHRELAEKYNISINNIGYRIKSGRKLYAELIELKPGELVAEIHGRYEYLWKEASTYRLSDCSSRPI